MQKIDEISKKLQRPPLWLCIVFDAIGCLSYIVPVWGEYTDAIWAPIAALLFYLAFGGRTGKIGAAVTFVEELLPFTDFVPLFTIGWFVKKHEKNSETE